jgi:hypothetical protein
MQADSLDQAREFTGAPVDCKAPVQFGPENPEHRKCGAPEKPRHLIERQL